ncbi:MAG: tripartite tricarboxylate transporter substrate binding protein [Rubrivivax sp.]
MRIGKADGLLFSSGSNGSPGHLAAAILGESTGVKVTHVPYKGNSPAVLAVLSGEVQAGILATPGMLPHVKAGKITALAVTSKQRSQIAPDLPTVAEAGMKDLEVEVLYVAMVPAATPEPVMAVLQKAIADALAQPDVKAQLARLDMFVEGLTGAAATERLRAQGERYARIIKNTGMKIE